MSPCSSQRHWNCKSVELNILCCFYAGKRFPSFRYAMPHSPLVLFFRFELPELASWEIFGSSRVVSLGTPTYKRIEKASNKQANKCVLCCDTNIISYVGTFLASQTSRRRPLIIWVSPWLDDDRTRIYLGISPSLNSSLSRELLEETNKGAGASEPTNERGTGWRPKVVRRQQQQHKLYGGNEGRRRGTQFDLQHSQFHTTQRTKFRWYEGWWLATGKGKRMGNSSTKYSPFQIRSNCEWSNDLHKTLLADGSSLR